jgi:hypothetical protein
MTNVEIANTILKQLGGTGRLNAMTGAKNFVAIENGVQFKIGRNSKSINTVIIRLNGRDLYDVEFGRTRKYEFKVVNRIEDAYNDMLKDLFESNTGMYLTF